MSPGGGAHPEPETRTGYDADEPVAGTVGRDTTTTRPTPGRLEATPLRLEKVELARQTGVSLATIKRLENLDGRFDARLSTIETLERFFAERKVSFYDDDAPGARLHLGAAV